MRTPKNPDNTLVRLRSALSTANHNVTRKELSRRTGVSWAGIKEIERGVYGITPKIAVQISLGVPVQAKSLLAGDNPLIGWDGEPVSSESKNLWELTHGPRIATVQALFNSLYGAVLQKQKGMLFTWMFTEWASEIADLLKVSEAVSEKLTNEHLGSFDYEEIPKQFHPRGRGPIAERWRSFFNAVDKEWAQIFEQKEDQDPVAGEKFAKLPFNSEERRKRQWESASFHRELRKQAIENVRKRSEEKNKEFMRSAEKRQHSKRRRPAA